MLHSIDVQCLIPDDVRMGQRPHELKIGLQLRHLLVIEHERLHCKTLSSATFDATVDHSIRPLPQFLQQLVFLVKELCVVDGKGTGMWLFLVLYTLGIARAVRLR